MKNKGFTLIELLAVIVILAIIAIIAVPTITKVVDKARKGAAEASALSYIDAVEKYIMLHDVNPTKYPYDLKNGTFNVASSTEISLLDIIVPKVNAEESNTTPALNNVLTVKGDKPTSGTVTTSDKGKVTSADMVIRGYGVSYADGVITTVSAACNTATGTKEITITEPGTITEDIAEFANVEITTDGLVKPTGTKTITENGTGIDVSGYATANVNVSSISDELDWNNAIALNANTVTPSNGIIFSTKPGQTITISSKTIYYNSIGIDNSPYLDAIPVKAGTTCNIETIFIPYKDQKMKVGNWNNAVQLISSVSNNTQSYTATTDGYIYFVMTGSGYGNVKVTINNIRVNPYEYSSATTLRSIPISKNTSLTFVSDNANSSKIYQIIYFVPFE